MAKSDFLAFRVNLELKRDIQWIADDEQRNVSQICEMLLYEGVEAYKKEGAKFMQRLIAKQRLRTKYAAPQIHREGLILHRTKSEFDKVLSASNSEVSHRAKTMAAVRSR